MNKTFQDKTLFGFSNFGHWIFFDIWNFNKSMKFQQSKSPLGITKAWSSGPGFLLYLQAAGNFLNFSNSLILTEFF